MKKILLPAMALVIVGVLIWPGGKSNSQTTDPVLIGAGDVGDGLNGDPTGALATAALIDSFPNAMVFVAGDLPHNNGTDGDYAHIYDAAWGRFKTRTIPALGNHEYYSGFPFGYFDYFGPAAGDPTKGYYSLNLGSWHIIVLNTNLACSVISCSAGSPQEVWLKNDLAANTQPCTMAIWHHPLYSSTGTGPGPTTAVRPFWTDLYNANAELVINGHAHVYERFAPQDANGNLDTARGIIEIDAGTGGASHFSFSTTAPNSLVRNNTAFGVLELTLHSSSFDWQFIPQAGQTFTDSGTQACH
jgi:hypothetical protein